MNQQMDNSQVPPMDASQDPMAGISFPMGDSAQAPVAPTMPQPGDGSENSDKYKEELKQMLDAIQEKVNAYNSQKIADDNEQEQIKGDLIEKVFAKMALDGVNLEDQNDINQYLADMEKNDPHQFELFSRIMDKLMEAGQDDQGQADQTDVGSLPGSFSNEGQATPPLDLSQVPMDGQQPQQ